MVVGAVLGGLWVFLATASRSPAKLMADIPPDGIHLVFAIDTSLLVPALVMAGVLLWRRSTAGFVSGPTMLVMGALYQVNLLVAGLFQANANVAGVKAFPAEGSSWPPDSLWRPRRCSSGAGDPMTGDRLRGRQPAAYRSARGVGSMTVVVAYASKHGSTEGIARAIAERLRELGVSAGRADGQRRRRPRRVRCRVQGAQYMRAPG